MLSILIKLIFITFVIVFPLSNNVNATEGNVDSTSEEFDIFDVVENNVPSIIVSESNLTTDSLSIANNQQGHNDFEDDLFVDIIEESEDDLEQSLKSRTAKASEDITQPNAPSVKTVQNDAKKAMSPSESLIKENEEFGDLLLGEDIEYDSLEESDIIPTTNEIPEEELTTEPIVESEAKEPSAEEKLQNNLDSFLSETTNNNDTNEISIPDIPADNDQNNVLRINIGDEISSPDDTPTVDTPDITEISQVKDDISTETAEEYKKLKLHLANFLQSFSNKTSTDSFAEIDELVLPDTLEDHTQIVASDEPVETNDSLDDSPSATNDESEIETHDFSDFLGIEEDITEEDIVENADKDESKDQPNNNKVVASNNLEQENDKKPIEKTVDAPTESQKPNAKQTTQKEKQAPKKTVKTTKPDVSRPILTDKKEFAGNCLDLPNKIKNCEQFACSMPELSGGSKLVNISVSKMEDGNCNFANMSYGKITLSCNLNQSERHELSNKTAEYFRLNGTGSLDIKSYFYDKCHPEAIKVAKATSQNKREPEITPAQNETVQAIKPNIIVKPRPVDISAADKAYFDLLNEKREKLPRHKQLPDSVVDTIEIAGRSIAQQQSPVIEKVQPEHYNVDRGGSFTPGSEEGNGIIRSNSGIDISIQDASSQTNDIKRKMDSAYRALLAGQVSASASLYKQVLDIEASNKDALFGLATAYHRNSQFEQAREIYAKILLTEPNNKEVLNNFLVLVAEDSPESSLIELQKLERVNSNFSPIPAQIAMIYLKMGSPEKAERYLRRAVILSPDNITYKYNLAITSDKLEKHYQAIHLYKQILEAAKRGAVVPGSINSIMDRLAFLESKVAYQQ